MKEQAKKELEEWYKHHKEAIDKTRSANRLVHQYFHVKLKLLQLSFNAHMKKGRRLCEY